MRDIIALQCSVCKDRNYTTRVNKKKQAGKLERKKFCRRCRKHTLHKESKVE